MTSKGNKQTAHEGTAVSQENPALKKEKDRLVQEFVHLDKTHKTGMLSSQEYTAAKKSLEKKQRSIEQKEKQETAKEKAVEEILGSASMLPISKKPAVKKTSEKVLVEKKRHEKYFMKLGAQKQHGVSVVPSHTPSKTHEPLEKKKEFQKEQHKEHHQEHHQEQHKEQHKELQEELQKERQESPKEPKQTGSSTRLQDISSAPSTPVSSFPVDQEQYKDIDELVHDGENHWRFALALLTIFLLILLYVKFTSYDAAEDVITVDAYLDPTSSYSKDMYLALQSLIAEYGDVLWVDYYLIGATDQAVLVSHAQFCAEKEERGAEFLSYYFNQEIPALDTEGMLSYASALRFDSAQFASCLSDTSYSALYAAQQGEAKELDVAYTPTLLVNNKKIVGAVGADAVKVVLDQELVKMG